MRVRAGWRVVDTMAAALLLGASPWAPVLVFPGLIAIGLAVYAWREVAIISDGVIYHRSWRWQEPFILDELAAVRDDRTHIRAYEPSIALLDRSGARWRFETRWYENWRPLGEYIVWRIATDLELRVDARAERRLRERLAEVWWTRRRTRADRVDYV